LFASLKSGTVAPFDYSIASHLRYIQTKFRNKANIRLFCDDEAFCPDGLNIMPFFIETE
jgi:hypothetical protein